MKRALIPLFVLLLLALAIVLGGKRALEYTLDARLAPLLSREIGVPVSLGPISTQLRTLTAHSTTLVMGEPQRPAVTAEDVTVSLDWQSLLRGEIRLVYASASQLTVQPSRWPGNDDPWPTDYNFLEPILPNRLEVAAGQYIGGDGEPLQVSALLWQRDGGGASLAWQQPLNNSMVDLKSELSSLGELLQLARLRLQLSMQRPDQPDTAISAMLDVQPDKGSGYGIDARLYAAGMQASIETGNTVAWEIPDTSATHIKELDLKTLGALITAYTEAGTEKAGRDLTEPLDASVPVLDLTKHQGELKIDILRWQDEVITDASVRFGTGQNSLELSSVTANGPAGQLTGRAGAQSGDDGWQISLLADITATGTDSGLAPAYTGNDWLWHTGHADLRGAGTTWGALLNSLRGKLSLAGSHRGDTSTPVTLRAELDSSPDKLILHHLDVRLGDGEVQGEVTLSGSERRKLTATVRANHLDLNFLIDPEKSDTEPGLPLPTFVDAFPGFDLDWQVTIEGFKAGGANLARIEGKLERTPAGGELWAQAIGMSRGKLELGITASTLPGEDSKVDMTLDMNDINLQQVFERTSGFIDVWNSGRIVTTATGKDLREIFAGMRGEANITGELELAESGQGVTARSNPFTLRGNARPLLDGNRIIGLEISQLALEAEKQTLQGELSMVEGRTPWLIADLTSSKLDIDALLALRSDPSAPAATTDTATDTVSLQALRDAGNTRISLQARAITLRGQVLPSADVEYSSTPDRVGLDKLEIDMGPGQLKGSGQLDWKGETAQMSLELTIEDVDVDRFLVSDTTLSPTPISGKVKLQSSGNTTASLIANMVGDIALQDSVSKEGAIATPARKVEMTARRTADGMEAQVRRLNWGETDLTGELRYTETDPPSVDITLGGGALSLAPWESATEAGAGDKKQGRDPLSTVTRTARAGADFVGELILSPFGWARDAEGAAPGERLFSDKPLPFEAIGKYRVSVKGRLDKVISRQATAEDVTLDAVIKNGRLNARLAAGEYNQGSAELELRLDTGESPAAIDMDLRFRDIHSDEKPRSFTRSGHFKLNSTGQSTADIAANMDGIVYLELGPGLLDYSEMMLLTADVATDMFRALIPGLEKQQPYVECGVTLGVLQQGQGVTPYGYAVRTREANLVGRATVDLRKEIIQLDISSSNRKGVGISVSSVFSNTVEIKGPLTDPELVPNTTGLLWRGWAAVMTGGLSVIGESMFKRLLASENPCDSVKEKIHQDFCPKQPAAAASAMICPAAQG